MDITNKRIMLSGGASGIGAAAVSALVAAGARVASLDIKEEAGRVIADAADRSGPGKAKFFSCDVSVRADVNRAFEQAAQWLGGLDSLVHAAGYELTEPAEVIDDDHWSTMMDVNARGTFHTNQAAFHLLRETGGSILNFSSAAGVIGMPGGAAYSAAKAAVLGWTRTVAKEWGRFGITVNAVAPAMWTPMYDAHRVEFSPEETVAHDAMMAMIIPIGGKLGDPARDLAPFLIFMVSDGARFITGQTLAVDGGMLIP